MPNRLADAASPYLLQHADNPVDWWEWSPEAFEEAKRLNRPVLLSIGYAACHWCHVMAHESFEDEAVAAVMNEHLVSIKVDREERPDVDQIYMAALHALGQQGGWPLTMFLTPAGDPFWGGTYFPKEAKYGRPGFPDVVRTLARVYSEEPERVFQNATGIAARLKPRPAEEGAFGVAELDETARRLVRVFDPVDGGFQGAPKFPQAGVLELMLRAAARTGEAELAAPAHLTLARMAAGGIHDHVGGGFARYSVDAQWLVPHFEKMLYDNAQLLPLYAAAGRALGDARLLDAAHGIVDWLEREMITEEGAFAASLDADSEGEEGKFYVWSRAELDEALGPDDAAFAAEALDISAGGNWEGSSIPNRLDAPKEVAVDEARLTQVRARMLAARAKRIRPGRDDKALADWNGLMIAALADVAASLHRPDALELAKRAFAAIVSSHARGDRLGHAFRAGRLIYPGFASDYGAMALAAIALAGATGDDTYRDHAARWLEAARAHHRNPAGPGYAVDADDAQRLVVRPEALMDEAMPSGTALILAAEVRLATYDADETRLARFDEELAALGGRMGSNVIGHAGLLNALDARLRLSSIVVMGEGAAADALHLQAMAAPPWERVVRRARSASDLPDGHPARAAKLSGAAALVCAGQACSAPATTPEALSAALANLTDLGEPALAISPSDGPN
ncbi:thioredoxin domain-containing protein [Chelatococcus sambhunathii]|uniref:Thioredoxin domain-containing protein n=1 Tax=Chelatococcus sambhunathii TaxID=363953 RepID=A0ABU1DFT9_9HYPH|nr:thioredoxin domain-containing protein [Chelatococcus sambhunathii]MDR4306898.1 thioredoxin domain-containing protein [Chelatococcus sambhunathii]